MPTWLPTTARMTRYWALHSLSLAGMVSVPERTSSCDTHMLITLEVIYKGAAGRTGLALDSPKFAVDSCSWVASLTKIITCTCLMQLVEKNLVKLDDDMRPLVPELAQMQILQGFDSDDKPLLKDNSGPITLR